MIVCQGTRKDGRPCRNVLGTVTDGVLELRHRGRWLRGALAGPDTEIGCEDCGEVWRPPLPMDRIAREALESRPRIRDQVC